MTFRESPRFPSDIAFGFSGGAGFVTRIAVLPSGKEKRNQLRSRSLGRWNATHGGKTQTETDTLIAYFQIMEGRTYGFRFKDVADYQVTAAQGVLSLIAGSPSNEYQMYKRYTQGSFTKDRLIAKPVSSTVTVSGGGSYTVNYAAGIVIHTGGAAPTGWAGEYDVPARFDTDEMNLEVIERGESGLLYTWGNVPIVEIRP